MLWKRELSQKLYALPLVKLVLVADLIRGKKVGEAYAILKDTDKKASDIVEKVLKSAVANAEHNLNLDVNTLYR